jgi:putative ABC transport system permease protein
MMSAVLRKSITDLTRRKARAFFTVLTLALAVASVGIFAVPAVMQQSMDREVQANRLADVTVSMKPLALDARDLTSLGHLPNVLAVEPRTTFRTRVHVGSRRDEAVLVGVPDFSEQQADTVAIAKGAPRPGGLLVEQAKVRKGDFSGTTARIVAADGSIQRMPITGEGRTLAGSSEWDFTTFYAPASTVAAIAGFDGYTSLSFRLRDTRPLAAERTVTAIRAHLQGIEGFSAFADLPVVREPGSYPGKSQFENLASLMNVVTLLALLSALVLLSNTMTTLVGEQTAEIAAMKAIGARRRDIRRIYLRTSALFGIAGAFVGIGLGILISNLVVGLFADMFFGIDAGFGVSGAVLAASLVVGLLGPPLAALPAVRRAARLPLGEALAASGSAVGGQGRVDAVLRRAGGLPRSVQIGLRGAGRRKRRTVATALQVGLAVATCLAFLSVSAGVGESTRAWFDDNHFDVWIQPQPGNVLDANTSRTIAGVNGVTSAQPWLSNAVKIDDTDTAAWGLPAEPRINTRISAGRWYSAAEVAAAARVAVLGRTIAKSAGAEVGDDVRLETANGPATFRVIGISANQANNGGVVYLPVSSLQAVLGLERTYNNYFIDTDTDEHALIDRTTSSLEDVLGAQGEQVSTFVNYEMRKTQVAANAQISMSITILGLLIVAISMVALINSITMGILERTREIGILRSIGARGRDVRRIFATEALVVALLGWGLGVPLGYLMARGLGKLAGDATGIDIAFVFSPANVPLTLLGTVILALIVMLAPLRRAVNFKPGDALRYA